MITVTLSDREARALASTAQTIVATFEQLAGDELQRVCDQAGVPPLVSAVMKIETAILVDSVDREAA